MAHHELQPGTIIAQRYEIVSLIGRGGFARIYKAIQLGMGRPVALKVFDPSIQQGEPRQFAARFEKEAIALSRLRSPATVIVHDFGQTPHGILYMALELVEGTSLAQALEQQGVFAPARVAKILRQALESLREAHHHGILHRDIKPANIMLHEHMGERDFVKLLDFGIARLFDDEAPEDLRETREGSLIGTPRYMAPEAIAGNALPASDLYSLGLVAYELLTGQKAYPQRSNLDLIAKQLEPESIKLPSAVLVPTEFRVIIDKMLEKQATRRWQHAAQIVEALRTLDLEDDPFEDHMATRPSVEASASVRAAFSKLIAPQDDAGDALLDESTRPSLKPPPGLTLGHDEVSSDQDQVSTREVLTPDFSSLQQPEPKPEKIIELTQPKRVERPQSAEKYSIVRPTKPLPDDWDNVEDTNPSINRPREERLIVLQKPSAAQNPAEAASLAQAPLPPKDVDAAKERTDAASARRQGSKGKRLILFFVLVIIVVAGAVALALFGPELTR